MKKIKPIKGFSASLTTQSKKIVDGENKNYYGVMYHTQKSLNKFMSNSKMQKSTDEYQHHYWSIIGRLEIDNEILDLNIPIVLYNYKQVVTGGSVSFHLQDVEDKSDELEDYAVELTEKFLSSDLCKEIEEKIPFEWRLVSMNTLHRHPGRLSTFSGTDYGKRDIPGIVFPLEECEDNTPSFSSIICHSDIGAELIRTECRLVKSTDKSIIYKKGKCITYIKGYTKELKPIESLFANEKGAHIESYVVENGIADINNLIKDVIRILSESNFEPDTKHIDDKNIIKKQIKHSNYSSPFIGSYMNKKNVKKEEPMIMLGEVYYKGNSYSIEEIEDMREELEELKVFDKKKLLAMTGKAIIKIYIDEGFGDVFEK